MELTGEGRAAHRRQPTRLPCPWDSPGKNTGVGCHFLLQCVKVKSLSCIQLLATPWTTAYQAPPSMGFSRQEYGVGCQCQIIILHHSLPHFPFNGEEGFSEQPKGNSEMVAPWFYQGQNLYQTDLLTKESYH